MNTKMYIVLSHEMAVINQKMPSISIGHRLMKRNNGNL